MEEEFQFEQLTYKKQRHNNDFGQGFYTGESYEQAISFVSGFDHSSVYYIRFDDKNLKCKRYEVDQDIRNLRRALDILNRNIKNLQQDQNNEKIFQQQIKQTIFPNGCSENCYYR